MSSYVTTPFVDPYELSIRGNELWVEEVGHVKLNTVTSVLNDLLNGINLN